jgi:hypothetical protein
MPALAEYAAAADIIAGLGHNQPPEPTAFDAFTAHIGDLFEEAKNHLDGAGINSEAEAEAVSKLLDLIRTASKDADKARTEEKKPHDDAAKAVQARWKPLLEKADLAVSTCKKALAPWLEKKDAEARAIAEAARQAAEQAARQAAEAMRAAHVSNLEAREDAEALVKDAAKAEAAAARAEKARPQAAGGARAVTLRTTYRPELTNPSDALKHYVATNPEAIKACLQRLAEVDVREGKRQLPGFTIHEERTVV